MLSVFVKEHDNVIAARRKAFSLAALGVLGFSGTIVATKFALDSYSPWQLTFYRAALAGLLATIYLLVRPPKVWPVRREWVSLAFTAAAIVLGFPALSSWALLSAPASHAAVIFALIPPFTAAFGALRARERPTTRFWVASLLGAACVAAFSVTRHADVPSAVELQARPGPLAADLVLIAAVCVAAFGYAEGARVARRLSGATVISLCLVLSAPIALVISAMTPEPLFHPDHVEAMLGLLYVGAVSMFVAFIAWYSGLSGAGIARASQLQLAQPLLSLLWAALLLDEAVPPTAWLTTGAVVACIAVCLRSTAASPAAARVPDPR